MEGRERKRWPPFPLSTLEMQKKATMYLRLPGERIMKLAEELYQAGFVSYPRTETDIFAAGFDLQVTSHFGAALSWAGPGLGNLQTIPVHQHAKPGQLERHW